LIPYLNYRINSKCRTIDKIIQYIQDFVDVINANK
jgi:hypothetical protein